MTHFSKDVLEAEPEAGAALYRLLHGRTGPGTTPSLTPSLAERFGAPAGGRQTGGRQGRTAPGGGRPAGIRGASAIARS